MRFKITHQQAVWERSVWYVEAEDEEEAQDKFHDGEAELSYSEVQDSLEFVDSETEVTRA